MIRDKYKLNEIVEDIDESIYYLRILQGVINRDEMVHERYALEKLKKSKGYIDDIISRLESEDE